MTCILAQSPVPVAIEGSELWRFFVIFTGFLIIAWQMWRGWRLGLPRTLASAMAILAAYGAGIFAGPWLVPVLRPMVHVPDFVISMIGGAGVGLVAYGVVSILGLSLFKKTKHQKNPVVHFFYGASGAVVGLAVGLLLVWMLLIALRLLGTLAESHYTGPQAKENTTPQSAPAIARVVAKLKNSVEMGPGAVLMNVVDPIPEDVYRILRKVTALVQSPESAERFLNYPGARELATHPTIVELTEDPAIRQLATKRDFMKLIQNERIIKAANDPELAGKLKAFPIEKALDYGLGPQPSAQPPEEAPPTRTPRV